MPERQTLTASEAEPKGMATDASYSRLRDMPTELLHRMLHDVGRPTRRVCRLFHTAYGPLDGGICLEHLSSGRDLRQLIATNPNAFRHIRTLLLHPSTANPPATLFTPVPAAFPALRSLHLGLEVTLKPVLLSALGPLAPHLTALAATIPPGGAAPLAATLTSLRSLSLACHPDSQTYADITAFIRNGFPDILSSLRPLARSLLHLTLAAPGCQYSPESTLASLVPFSSLTHLSLSGDHQYVEVWTPAAVHMLATAMPQLQSLHCGWEFRNSRTASSAILPPPTPDAIFAALCARTALTSLSFQTGNPYAHLHPLRLAHLSINSSGFTSLDQLLQAVGHSQTLTSLQGCSARLASVAQASSLLAPTLRCLSWCTTDFCTPASLLPLSQLSLLESLDLTLHWAAGGGLPDSDAATIAAALGRLTSLALHVNPPYCYFTGEYQAPGKYQYPLAALVRQVARRGALRHLALDGWQPCWGEALLGPQMTSLVRLSVTMLQRDIWESVWRLGHLRALRSLCIKVSQASSQPWAPLQAEAASGVAAGSGSEASPAQGAVGASSSGGVTAGIEASAQPAEEVADGSAGAEQEQQANGSSEAGALGVLRLSTRLQKKKQQQQQAARGASAGRSAQQAPNGSNMGLQGQGATRQAAAGNQRVQLPPGLRQLCLDVVCRNGHDEVRCVVGPVLAAAARQDCVVHVATPMAPLSRLRPAAFDDCHGYRDGAAVDNLEAQGRL